MGLSAFLSLRHLAGREADLRCGKVGERVANRLVFQARTRPGGYEGVPSLPAVLSRGRYATLNRRAEYIHAVLISEPLLRGAEGDAVCPGRLRLPSGVLENGRRPAAL